MYYHTLLKLNHWIVIALLTAVAEIKSRLGTLVFLCGNKIEESRERENTTVYSRACIDNCTVLKAIQSVIIIMPRRKRVRIAMSDEAKQRLKESDKGSYYNQEAWVVQTACKLTNLESACPPVFPW